MEQTSRLWLATMAQRAYVGITAGSTNID